MGKEGRKTRTGVIQEHRVGTSLAKCLPVGLGWGTREPRASLYTCTKASGLLGNRYSYENPHE